MQISHQFWDGFLIDLVVENRGKVDPAWCIFKMFVSMYVFNVLFNVFDDCFCIDVDLAKMSFAMHNLVFSFICLIEP